MLTKRGSCPWTSSIEEVEVSVTQFAVLAGELLLKERRPLAAIKDNMFMCFYVHKLSLELLAGSVVREEKDDMLKAGWKKEQWLEKSVSQWIREDSKKKVWWCNGSKMMNPREGTQGNTQQITEPAGPKTCQTRLSSLNPRGLLCSFGFKSWLGQNLPSSWHCTAEAREIQGGEVWPGTGEIWEVSVELQSQWPRLPKKDGHHWPSRFRWIVGKAQNLDFDEGVSFIEKFVSEKVACRGWEGLGNPWWCK